MFPKPAIYKVKPILLVRRCSNVFWTDILSHLGWPPSEGKGVDNTIPCQRLLSLLILDKGTAVDVSGTLPTVTAARVWDGGRGAK